MKVCIVGHGPSLIGANKGPLIDSHDKVVRMKHGLLNNSDYGSKTDLLVASTEVPGCFKREFECIAYPKKGWFQEAPIQGLGFPVEVPLNLCNMWNAFFREMGPRHPNVSTGTAAILIAAHRFRPDEIVLAGFDTLMNPDIEFSRNDAIPRTGIGDYPDHDWETENKLLKDIGYSYGLTIKPL